MKRMWEMQRFSVNMCGCNCWPRNRVANSYSSSIVAASSLTCVCRRFGRELCMRNAMCALFCVHRLPLTHENRQMHVLRTRYNLFMQLGQNILKLDGAPWHDEGRQKSINMYIVCGLYAGYERARRTRANGGLAVWAPDGMVTNACGRGMGERAR